MLRVLAAICVGGFLVLAACSSGGDASISPLPTPGFFGIEAVDSAIANIRSDDPAALLDSLVPVVIDCAEHTRGFLEGPTCEDADGGILEGLFPVTNCFLRYGTVEEAQQSVRGWLEAGSGPEVYGVYPAGGNDHAIVLRTILADRVAGWVLVVNEEGTVGFSSGCLQAPDAVVGAWRFGAQTFSQSQRTPTPSPTPLPTPPLTGIASIDAAIDAIQRQDADALVSQMRMTRLACEAEPMGLSIFPFCGDEPNGTLVESFPIATCEGAYRRIEHSGPAVRRLLEGADTVIFAVFTTKGTRFEESFYSHADPSYVVVIQSSRGVRKSGVAVLVDERGLVGSLSGCADTPESMVEFWELTDAIVPPPPTATPTPTPQPITNSQTGIGSVDKVLRIIEENDGEALEAMGRTIDVPCEEEHPITPNPPCREEETVVAAIPANFCSQHYQRGIGDLATFFRFDDDRQILAVHRTTGSLLQENFLGVVEHEYVVFFTAGLAHSPRTTMLLLDEEAIVAYGNTCQLSLEDFILGQHLTDPIIPAPQER